MLPLQVEEWQSGVIDFAWPSESQFREMCKKDLRIRMKKLEIWYANGHGAQAGVVGIRATLSNNTNSPIFMVAKPKIDS